MRTTLLAAALFCPAALSAATFSRPAIEVPVIGFKAELNDGRVLASWHRYKRDDFKSYAMVKSSTKDSPMYPDDAAFWTSSNIGDIKLEDGKIAAGTWRYRLFITTVFGDRWMSPVIAITIKPEDLRRAPPTAADFEP